MIRALKKVNRGSDANIRGKNVLETRNSKCKGPEVRICMACWKNSKSSEQVEAAMSWGHRLDSALMKKRWDRFRALGRI